MKLSPYLIERLICPASGHALMVKEDSLTTADGQAYPIVDGRPILIDEANSIFDIEDIKQQKFKPKTAS